jgi:hypothetical protein
MIKREQGWGYLFVGHDGKTVSGADTKNCANCHRITEHDSVFTAARAR